MSDKIFCAIHSRATTDYIEAARHRVVYAAPGINIETAQVLLAFSRRSSEQPQIILDCSEDVFRLGYGDVQAVRLLTENGLIVRQSGGLRLGLLVCDDRAWCFSPVALSVEEESKFDEMPNAVALLPEQAKQILFAVQPQPEIPDSLFNERKPTPISPYEIGAEPLYPEELTQVEQALAIAPPLKFDIARKVNVFLPYIQYVEMSLTGCAINRHTVSLPPEILNLAQNEALRDRLQTTYRLIGKDSELSSKPLQDKLDKLREEFSPSLGKPWGRIMLRGNRSELDKCLTELKTELEAYQKDLKAKIKAEIDKSITELSETFLPIILKTPPASLRRGVMGVNPTEEEAAKWLNFALRKAFPTVEKIIQEMKLEVAYKDVTYETLTEPGLEEALKKKFPLVAWDKPFQQFDAARARPENEMALDLIDGE